jgi:hypothetical protein
MNVMTKDRIADVIEVRHLHFVEQDAILKFARVTHHHAVSGNHIFAHVTTTADAAIFTNPRRAFEHRALLDDCSSADENMIADERLSHQLAENCGL